MARKLGSKARILKFLLDHVGEVVTRDQLRKVARPATEDTRRLRDLREEGWQISSHNDDKTLKPGEYRLESTEPAPYVFARRISSRIRAEVLERNGGTCQMCGASAGDIDSATNRPTRLHIGHIVDRSHGGKDELTNLRALCSTCNQGAKNIAQEPPSWTWLLTQVRRAKLQDQRAVLDWLKSKFKET